MSFYLQRLIERYFLTIGFLNNFIEILSINYPRPVDKNTKPEKLRKYKNKYFGNSIARYICPKSQWHHNNMFKNLMVLSEDPLTTSLSRYCKQAIPRRCPFNVRTKSHADVLQTCSENFKVIYFQLHTGK